MRPIARNSFIYTTQGHSNYSSIIPELDQKGDKVEYFVDGEDLIAVDRSGKAPAEWVFAKGNWREI